MVKQKKAAIAGRLGALRRNQLYGNPGTPDGRSKGGRATIKLFQDHPDAARLVGFVIRKEVARPVKSEDLAELFGVILGDGGFKGNHQLAVSFNYQTDFEYAQFVGNNIKRMFGLDYTICKRKSGNGADLIVGGTNLIDFLVRNGLRKGNKVSNQVSVPDWINGKFEYRIACLRGLMDTDGGLYRHRYISNGKRYEYLKLCFTNYSRPLLIFVLNTLKQLRIRAYLNNNHVSIYALNDVRNYFLLVGSNNPKHVNRRN